MRGGPKSEVHTPAAKPESAPQAATWNDRYGEKYRFRRITEFPLGVRAPAKVRIYQRAKHLLLQWWDPAAKRNLSERIEGDLVAAIMRARQIEERLEHFKSGNPGRRRLAYSVLMGRFVEDLHQRADAGDLDPRSVARYESALEHFRVFVAQPEIQTTYPSATHANRAFALHLSQFLNNLRVSPNGHAHTAKRCISSAGYIYNVVRSMFAWAADPDRGGMMPDGFRSPFRRLNRDSAKPARDLFGEPDITLRMAGEFLEACDEFQLPLFTLLTFYGLRASEPCFLFQEHWQDDWLKVICLPDLAYVTKGRRDKRLPLLPQISRILAGRPDPQPAGLLFRRRAVVAGNERTSFQVHSLEMLKTEFEVRCRRERHLSARRKHELRDQLWRDAGGIAYDHIEHEFLRVAEQLKWPRTATLKDFRHLYATALENGGIPSIYKGYLLGHTPARGAAVHYTHLNELRERYQHAVVHQLELLIEILTRRLDQSANRCVFGPNKTAAEQGSG